MPINLVIIAQKMHHVIMGPRELSSITCMPFLLINIMVSIELELEPDSSSILVSLSRDYNILNYMPVLSNFSRIPVCNFCLFKKNPFYVTKKRKKKESLLTYILRNKVFGKL